MTTTCQGTWRGERELGETGITVLTCSDCREIWAFTPQHTNMGHYPPGTDDMTLIRDYLLKGHHPNSTLD
jgi:hypothetical protein